MKKLKPTIRGELIGPGEAKKLLGRSEPRETSRVEELAKGFRKGVVSREPLVFDEKGTLVEGEQLLLAVIETGLDIPFRVIRGKG